MNNFIRSGIGFWFERVVQYEMEVSGRRLCYMLLLFTLLNLNMFKQSSYKCKSKWVLKNSDVLVYKNVASFMVTQTSQIIILYLYLLT